MVWLAVSVGVLLVGIGIGGGVLATFLYIGSVLGSGRK